MLGASRSRTGRMSCPLVSWRFLQCPPALNVAGLRFRWFPSVSSWFRECVTQLWHSLPWDSGDPGAEVGNRVQTPWACSWGGSI